MDRFVSRNLFLIITVSGWLDKMHHLDNANFGAYNNGVEYLEATSLV